MSHFRDSAIEIANQFILNDELTDLALLADKIKYVESQASQEFTEFLNKVKSNVVIEIKSRICSEAESNLKNPYPE